CLFLHKILRKMRNCIHGRSLRYGLLSALSHPPLTVFAGRAAECAQAFARASLAPVHIVRGGFERFSALYPFLRTQKIIYTVTELENLLTYPVEVIAGLLYMGDQKQLMDAGVLGDLKISAVHCVTGHLRHLKPISYTRYSQSHILRGSRVLVVSREGRSRCSAVTMAFLMYHLAYSLEASQNVGIVNGMNPYKCVRLSQTSENNRTH
uniref:Uncharacterized protein n=1 Tax=Mola mola TaxID=94237 RepID=A0A3Q3WT38_MOLML